MVSPEPHGQQVFSTFLREAATLYSDLGPWEVELGLLDAVRDFVCLEDVVTAIERAIDRDVAGETINVCTGHGRAVGALVQDVVRQLAPGAIKSNPGRPAGVPWSVGDPSRCGVLLGFAPSADLGDVTSRAAAWVKAQAKAGAHA